MQKILLYHPSPPHHFHHYHHHHLHYNHLHLHHHYSQHHYFHHHYPHHYHHHPHHHHFLLLLHCNIYIHHFLLLLHYNIYIHHYPYFHQVLEYENKKDLAMMVMMKIMYHSLSSINFSPLCDFLECENQPLCHYNEYKDMDTDTEISILVFLGFTKSDTEVEGSRSTPFEIQLHIQFF
ncbi:hypothetical protein RIR_v02004351100 [Rhizophagus irregularis DAOM 181602=DAOM 197198]|nr:hypothetical protein RIR_v02004351100 [Rhizophagus irregularis DAOM 181602=DAOM 197198]